MPSTRAVGHDEVILATADAGRTWRRTHYAPDAQRPLLDVWCGAGGHAIAVGAYSAYFTSEDGGASWTAGKLAAAPPPKARAARRGAPAGAADEARREAAITSTASCPPAPPGCISPAKRGTCTARTMAARTGVNSARRTRESFFGVLPLQGEAVRRLACAATSTAPRTRLELAEDRNRHGGHARWRGPLDDAGVAIVGLAGVVLVSRDGGRTFTLLQQSDRAGLSAALPAGDDEIAAVGEAGGKLISLRTRRRAREPRASGRRRPQRRCRAHGAGFPARAADLRASHADSRTVHFGTMLLAAVAVRGLRIDASFNKTLPVRHEYMRTYLDPKVAEFRGANRVLIALIARDGNMFTPEFFAALRKATTK